MCDQRGLVYLFYAHLDWLDAAHGGNMDEGAGGSRVERRHVQ